MTCYYISGPMRGYKHFNFPAFRECESYLHDAVLKDGWDEVLNPARRDAEEDGLGWYPDENIEITDEMLNEWMRRDLADVATSDWIVLLPGWRDSVGAKREVQVARWCGLTIVEYDPDAYYGFRFTFLREADVDASLTEGVDKTDTVNNMSETAYESFKQDVGRPMRASVEHGVEYLGDIVLERTDVAQQGFIYGLQPEFILHTPVTSDFARSPKRLRTDEQNEVLGIFTAMLALPTGDGGTKRARGEKPSWKVDKSHKAAAYRHLDEDRERYDEDSGAHKYVHAAWRLLAVAYQEMVEDGLVEADPE